MTRLDRGCLDSPSQQCFVATRELSEKETALARAAGLKRYCRPALTAVQTAAFFSEFDQFWDGVVRRFPSSSPFWRNSVSSKMQEWEQSVANLAVTLFSLRALSPDTDVNIVFVCDGPEEANLVQQWAIASGWRYRVQPRGRVLPRFVRSARTVLGIVLLCLATLRVKFATRSHRQPERFDVLLTSGFYDNSFGESGYRDPFFGDLHLRLAAQGDHPFYLGFPLGPISRGTWRKLCRADQPMLLPHEMLSWPRIIGLAIRMLSQRLDFGEAIFADCDFGPVLRWHARRTSNAFTWYSEVLYAGIVALCRRYGIKRLICNFEGNAWERAAVQAFRECSPGAAVGYCQGVVFRSNLKLWVTPGERACRPEPDRFICTGTKAKDAFDRTGRDASRTFAGCSLRPLAEGTRRSNPAEKTLLIALDGVWGTVSVLDWLTEHSDVLRGWSVRIRAHPNVPAVALKQRVVQPMPSSFQFSSGDLAADIGGATCVLYRHSSVGIQAMKFGIPVIQLAIDSPISCDPLEGVSTWKWSIGAPDDLRSVLAFLADCQPNAAQIAEMRRVADGYFAPPQTEKIAQFMH